MDGQLVYDVGAYDGDDSAYYLARGFRVVAIEADPDLAAGLRNRFSAEVGSGRCTVLNVGVAETDGEASFFLCPENPVWNSFDRSMASREGKRCVEIKVPCRTFGSILREFGVPHFLKVDIEGSDGLCLRALEAADLPLFVSFEANEDAPDLVRHMEHLGYRRFRLVSQRGWRAVAVPPAGSAGLVAWAGRQWLRLTLRRFPSVHHVLKKLRGSIPLASVHEPSVAVPGAGWHFPPGSSGPMPSPDAPGWMDLVEFMHVWVAARAGGILESSWFDVHAALGDPTVQSGP